MNVRAQAVGMASQTQNVANTIMQQFFPIFLDNEGFYAFYMFAGINFLLAIFVYFFIPETKQVSLEEIDALFGAPTTSRRARICSCSRRLLGSPGREEQETWGSYCGECRGKVRGSLSLQAGGFSIIHVVSFQ